MILHLWIDFFSMDKITFGGIVCIFLVWLIANQLHNILTKCQAQCGNSKTSYHVIFGKFVPRIFQKQSSRDSFICILTIYYLEIL